MEELHRRLKRVLADIGDGYEIIAIDNGSQDRTAEKLAGLSPITIITFSRNMGQNAALDAGLRHARGDVIVTLDGDLQNPPEEIPKLLEKINEGYDAVVGWRKRRGDSAPRRAFSRCANALVSYVTGVKLHDFSCALKCFRKKHIAGVRLLGETFIFLPVFAHANGARLAEVEVIHDRRKHGRSKYGIWGMSRVLFDLITVKFMLSYFGKPLRFFGSLSLIFWGAAGVLYGWAIALKIGDQRNFTETPLPLLGAMFVVVGVLIFMLGFLAEILLRIYSLLENGPRYPIEKIVENKE